MPPLPDPISAFWPLSARLRKLIRYLCAGTTAAGANLLILFVLVHYFGVHYLSASVLGVLGSMAFGFALQKFWTFKDQVVHRMHFQFLGYISISGMNLIINTGLMYLFVSKLGIWYLAAQVMAGAVIAITGYIGYQRFVFKAVSVPQ